MKDTGGLAALLLLENMFFTCTKRKSQDQSRNLDKLPQRTIRVEPLPTPPTPLM